jgi:lipoate-protein ligase A
MRRLPSGWHCLVEAAPLPGAEQMARDAGLRTLAAAHGAPMLRLYGWSPACISFGAHEAAQRRFSPEAIAALGFDAVRRPTGGRAVLHRDDLTYAVALPPDADIGLEGLLAGVHQIFAAALARLGVASQAAPRRRAPAPDGGGICFDAPVGGELLLDGAKLLGSAQHQGATGILQHGSLLLADGQHDLRRVRREDLSMPADAPIATVGTALGRPIRFDEMAACLTAAWTDATGDLQPLHADAVHDAAGPHRAQFSDPAWTWRR